MPMFTPADGGLDFVVPKAAFARSSTFKSNEDHMRHAQLGNSCRQNGQCVGQVAMHLQRTNTAAQFPAAWCSTISARASMGDQQPIHASMCGMPQQVALPAALGQSNCYSSMPVVVATQRASAPIPPPLARLGEAPYVWEPSSFPGAPSTNDFPSLPQQSISRLGMPPVEQAKQLMHPGAPPRAPIKLSSQLNNNGLNYSAQQQAQSRLRTLLLFAQEAHTPTIHRSNSNCPAAAKPAGQQQQSVLGRPDGPGPMMQAPQIGGYAAVTTSSRADFTTIVVQPQKSTGPAPVLDIQGMRSILATVQTNSKVWVQDSQANEGSEPMDWEACAPYPVVFPSTLQGQRGPVNNVIITAARVKSPERVSVMTLTSPAHLTGTAQPPHQVEEHNAKLEALSKKTGYVKKQATWLFANRTHRKANYTSVLQHMKRMHAEVETEVVMIRQELDTAQQLEQQQLRLQSPMQVITCMQMQFERLHEDLLEAGDLLQRCEETEVPIQISMGAVTHLVTKADTEQQARAPPQLRGGNEMNPPQAPVLRSSAIDTPDGHVVDVIDSPATKAAMPGSNKVIAAGMQEGKAPASMPVKKAAARKQLATPSIRSKLAAACQQQSKAAASTPTKIAVTRTQLPSGDIDGMRAASTANTTQSGNSSAGARGNSTPPARRGLNLSFGCNKDSLSSRQHHGLASVFDAPVKGALTTMAPNNATSAQQRPMQLVGQRRPAKLTVKLSPSSMAVASQLAAASPQPGSQPAAAGTTPSSPPNGSRPAQVTARRNSLNALLAYDDGQLDTKDQTSGSKPAAQAPASKGPTRRVRKFRTPHGTARGSRVVVQPDHVNMSQEELDAKIAEIFGPSDDDEGSVRGDVEEQQQHEDITQTNGAVNNDDHDTFSDWLDRELKQMAAWELEQAAA